MKTFYLFLVVFLFMLTIIDLSVGVSDDAVNFLGSAIGARTTSFKVVIAIAAVGVFVGAALSNGIVDIARYGIYQPQHFYFSEIMCILAAVMLTDVVLLDTFNSLGMPTSITASMMFELVGGTVATTLVKTASSSGALQLGDLPNTGRVFTMILGIFLSVAVAFFFGVIVQYLSRILLSFSYRKSSKYFVGLFGDLAATSIIYFMLIRGLKTSSLMTDKFKDMVYIDTGIIVLGCMVSFAILTQILHWLKMSVFKVTILMSTFALTLAFAGNDLVNFIEVPLVGYSSYMDLMAQEGTTTMDTSLMTSLLGPAQTPWYFLVGSGIVMVIALATSKRTQDTVRISLDLSRQSDGEEFFGTSPVAWVLVWNCNNISATILSIVPTPVKSWIDSRFDQSKMIIDDKADFDLVRTSVSVVLSGLLVALGASLKLPLSTTYVAFMVAMGTSLTDRAWGRESAVYRITGVLSVIDGWFITAGAALAICLIVALLIYWGGIPALVAMIGLAIYSLVRNRFAYRAKLREEASKEGVNSTVSKLRKATDTREALALFREHSREELQSDLDFTAEVFGKTVSGFMNEDFRGLRKALTTMEGKKVHLKQVEHVGTLGVTQLDHDIVMEKGLYYYQGDDFASEIILSIRHLAEPLEDHINSNFSPLSPVQKDDFGRISGQIISFLRNCATMIRKDDYIGSKELIAESVTLMNQLTALKKGELKRTQGQSGSTKVSMVCLNIVQEAQNVISFTANPLKVGRKFQKE